MDGSLDGWLSWVRVTAGERLTGWLAGWLAILGDCRRRVDGVAGWLAGWLFFLGDCRRRVDGVAGWLAGWMAGWLAVFCRSPSGYTIESVPMGHIGIFIISAIKCYIL
jgi:uncharacterized membrane protein YeaQ/YmgE (transglycosylase-associated protein family)